MNKNSFRLPQYYFVSVVAGLAMCAAMATTIIGCGDDEGTATVVALGPPALGIASPDEGACMVLTDEGAVRIKIETQNWSLRPQGFCGGVYSQCGFAVFLVDEQEVVRSSSLITDVSLAGLPSPTGAHRIRVELRSDGADDVAELDRDGEPLAAERNITTVAATEVCP